MKKNFTALCFFFQIANCLAQGGNLDSTFGLNGKVTTAVTAHSSATAVGLQPDGKIIAAGHSDSGITVIRYLSNGIIDSSFGINGIVTRQALLGTALIVEPNGKIITAGGDEYLWIILRFKSDGAIDSSFGVNGEFILDMVAPISSIALQSDSKIVIGGTYYDAWNFPHNSFFYLARCDSNGILDSTFHSDAHTFDGYNAGIYEIAIQPDGKIISTGYTDSSDYFYPYFGSARFNDNGTLDSTFGVNGHVTTAIGFYSRAHAIAIQSDGKIVVGGGSSDSISNPKYHFTLARYNSDGSMDNTFGISGVVRATIDSSSSISSLAIQSDGKIIALGYVNESIALARYNSDGTIDNTFGANGIVTNGAGIGHALVIQPDKKILTAGGYYAGFTLIRYLSGLEVGVLDFSIDDLSTLIYPNPIQSEATLQYSLANEEYITISLFDLQGRMIQNFISNQMRSIGKHEEQLCFGQNLTAGEYLLNISNGIHSQSIKIVKQ